MGFQEARDTGDSQNLMRAGLVAKRSPLIALAKIYPALCARAQTPLPGRVIPRFHAEAIRARPTITQYDIASATVDQKMISAFPYGEFGRGARGVVCTSTQSSSFENGSTARSRVMRVVSSRFIPQGTVDVKAKGPAVIGQYEVSLVTRDGRGLGGRIF